MGYWSGGQYIQDEADVARSHAYEPKPGSDVPLTGGVIANQGPSIEKEQEQEVARARGETKEAEKKDLEAKMKRDSGLESVKATIEALVSGGMPREQAVATAQDPYGIRGGKPLNGDDARLQADVAKEPAREQKAAAGEQAANVTQKVGKILNKVKSSTTAEDISPPVDMSDLSANRGSGALAGTEPPPAPARDLELEAATRESNIRHKVGMIFQAFGIQPTDMDQPLEALAQKRQLAREHDQDVIQQEQHDPSSRPSRLVQVWAVKKGGWSLSDAQGLTAADWPIVQAGYTADQVRLARLDATKERKYQADLQRQSKLDELAERRYEAQLRALAAKGEKGPSDKAMGLMIGYQNVENILNRMPEDFNPVEMERWHNRLKDRIASEVNAGRMNKTLLDTASKFTPNWWTNVTDLLGMHRANKMRQEIQDQIDQDRAGTLDIEELAKRDVSGWRQLYGPTGKRAGGAGVQERQSSSGVQIGNDGKRYIYLPDGRWQEVR